MFSLPSQFLYTLPPLFPFPLFPATSQTLRAPFFELRRSWRDCQHPRRAFCAFAPTFNTGSIFRLAQMRLLSGRFCQRPRRAFCAFATNLRAGCHFRPNANIFVFQPFLLAPTAYFLRLASTSMPVAFPAWGKHLCFPAVSGSATARFLRLASSFNADCIFRLA